MTDVMDRRVIGNIKMLVGQDGTNKKYYVVNVDNQGRMRVILIAAP